MHLEKCNHNKGGSRRRLRCVFIIVKVGSFIGFSTAGIPLAIISFHARIVDNIFKVEHF